MEFTFNDFQADLEDLHETHSERVRRESEVTYYDEYAKNELLSYEPRLYEQVIEGWSRSYYSGQKHLQAIMQYALPNKSITMVDQHDWNQSVIAVKNGLRSLPTVRAFSIESQLDQVYYIQSSSAGYGYQGAKGPLYHDNHMRAIRRAKATLYSAIKPDGEGLDYAIKESVPDVGYTRTQLADITQTTKVRGVWGRAFHYILLEGASARPLLEAAMSSSTFIMVGRDPVKTVPVLLSNTSAQCRWLTALDWQTFDATVNRFEIDTAFSILKEHLIFPTKDDEQNFEFCRLMFIHKKIAAPDGKIYWSHKGIPSGSYYTSLIGSIVNRLRIEYLWRLKFNRGPQICYTLGDDSLIGDDDFYSPTEIANKASDLGWILNPNKTECSTIPGEVTFLGRTSKGNLNHRDLKRCLRLLILPEYQVTSGSISAFRAQSIAEDAGNTSEILNTIARRLKRRYGIADEADVPTYLRRYTFQ
ncbi:ORF1 [Dactylorhiza cryptic virus 1]|nr:ORF1 [Dactylorhiza cryptic virus 1]